MASVDTRVPSRSLADRVGVVARPFAAATVAGAASGLFVGGVLGRIGMRVIAALSPAGTQGLLTDDGAAVGAITVGGSLVLAGFTTALGAVGGLAYLGVRRVLPGSRRIRMLGFGLFTGAAGGGLFVHDTTLFDFGVLRPHWFSVSLFVLLPLAHGLLASWLCEYLLSTGSWFQRLPVPVLLPVGILVLVRPETMILGVVVVLAGLVVTSVPLLFDLWRSRPLTMVGAAVYVAVVAFGLFSLARDIAA